MSRTFLFLATLALVAGAIVAEPTTSAAPPALRGRATEGSEACDLCGDILEFVEDAACVVEGDLLKCK